MAYLNPHWLAEVGAVAPKTGFIVYAISYPYGHGHRDVRQWSHKTPAAALRRLGSLCSGKLRKVNDHVVFAMNAKGECFSYMEIKRGEVQA